MGETGEIGVNAEGSSVAVQNNFGKSSWFKATMITSAGLSGGLSSSIAGGSFWAGARQGVIVATMNHLAHMGFDKSGEGLEDEDDIDQEDPKQNSNNQKPNPSEMHSSFNVKKGAVWENRGGRPSMINSKGQILEWDKQHGEIEKYNPKSPKIKDRHLGGFNPKTGTLRNGSIDPGRKPNRGWSIQNNPASTPNLKSIINPRSSIFDYILGGPYMQMQIELLKQDCGLSSPYQNRID